MVIIELVGVLLVSPTLPTRCVFFPPCVHVLVMSVYQTAHVEKHECSVSICCFIFFIHLCAPAIVHAYSNLVPRALAVTARQQPGYGVSHLGMFPGNRSGLLSLAVAGQVWVYQLDPCRMPDVWLM